MGNHDVKFLTCNYNVRCLEEADTIVNDQVKINCFSDLADLVGTVIKSSI